MQARRLEAQRLSRKRWRKAGGSARVVHGWRWHFDVGWQASKLKRNLDECRFEHTDVPMASGRAIEHMCLRLGWDVTASNCCKAFCF